MQKRMMVILIIAVLAVITLAPAWAMTAVKSGATEVTPVSAPTRNEQAQSAQIVLGDRHPTVINQTTVVVQGVTFNAADYNRVVRSSRNGKPVPVEFQHSAEAIINTDQGWQGADGRLHLKSSVGATEIEQADRRLPFVLQSSIRVDRQNISKLFVAVNVLDRRITSNSWVSWLALVLAAIGIVIGLWRYAEACRRRRGYYSH